MNTIEKNTSISKAREVLNQYWDGVLPVNPSVIAERMGIPTNAVCDNECSGKAYIKNGRKVIEYNSGEPQVRQKFTIAHELGHHMLGHTADGHRFRDEVSQFSVNVHDREETEANQFAAELLAPEIAIKHLVYKENINSLEKLAHLFNVSTVAMKYRLINLGIL